jgi:hypothetical protein
VEERGAGGGELKGGTRPNRAEHRSVSMPAKVRQGNKSAKWFPWTSFTRTDPQRPMKRSSPPEQSPSGASSARECGADQNRELVRKM